MTIKEEWRPVVGFEGLYEVSNTGQVRNIKGKLLKSKNCKGYLEVGLYCNGKRHQMSIHRLVSEAFIPNPEGLPMVNHKDEVKTNNNVDNLEWCDAKYNNNYGTKQERVRNTMLKKGYWSGLSKKEYYEKNKDKIKEYNKEYREKNKEKIKEQIREYKREYRKKNKDKIKEKMKEYRENNKDKIKEYNKEYYEKNKDKIKSIKKEYYEKKIRNK